MREVIKEVVCIDDSGFTNKLTNGNIYSVLFEYGDSCDIIDDNGNEERNFRTRRFKDIEVPKVEKNNEFFPIY